MRTTRCSCVPMPATMVWTAWKTPEHGVDAFLAVRPHGADFGQRGTRVRAQRSVPDDPRHVLQTGGEAAEELRRPSRGAPRSPRHWAHVTSEIFVGSKPSLAAGLPSARPGTPLDCRSRISAGSSGRGRYWRRGPTTARSEPIFFRPMPGVADRSTNGVPSRSRSVRPRKANGSRRSVGSAQ